MTRYGVIEHIHQTDQHGDRDDWIGAPCEIISTQANLMGDPNYVAAQLKFIQPDIKEGQTRFFFAVKIREVDFLEVCRILVNNSKGA